MNLKSRDSASESLNPCRPEAIDYIEFYVGNVRQAAHFYRTAFGLTPTAYAGLETGLRDRASCIVEHEGVRLVLTSALDPDSPIAEHVNLHGDGVKDIAFRTQDAARDFQAAVKRGARPVLEPVVTEDECGRFVKATIGACGDTVHSFIERDGYNGPLLPAYRVREQAAPANPNGVTAIDHVALSVEAGRLDEWIDFYSRVLGFQQSHQEEVATAYTGMNSKVVQDSTGNIKFSMMEPIEGRRKSQIDEFLSFYRGSGTQHIALSCSDIAETVGALRANGMEFLNTPGAYYDALEGRVGKIEEDVNRLRQFNILVDRDCWG